MDDWKQGGVYCRVHAREDEDENQGEDSRYEEKTNGELLRRQVSTIWEPFLCGE